MHNSNLYLHGYLIMKKREIVERKVLHEVNTNIKYIKTDGRKKDYISIQHKHEDYQLRMIIKGSGVCMVGEYLVEYQKGDILFVGRNVPHCSSLYEQSMEKDGLSESLILQFHPDLFPLKIDDLPDYMYINRVLAQSQSGLIFKDENLGIKVGLLMKRITKVTGVEKIYSLFKILELLGKSDSGSLISENPFDSKNTFCENQESLQRVYDYLYRNIKEEITLTDISDYVKLTPAALCRSFKSKTRMTIFQFLNKIRIENACKLLIYSDLTISQIAYESGFNCMAYFNRQFKKTTNTTPSEYRDKRNEVR